YDCENTDFERIILRQSNTQRCRDPCMLVLEHRIARSVSHGVRRFLADRFRRGAPQITIVVIMDVDAFAGRILYRIVIPWRQTERAVRSPRCARSSLAYEAAADGISHDVDPWSR